MDTEDAPSTAHMLIIFDINYFRPVDENEDAEEKERSPSTGFGASKILGIAVVEATVSLRCGLRTGLHATSATTARRGDVNFPKNHVRRLTFAVPRLHFIFPFNSAHHYNTSDLLSLDGKKLALASVAESRVSRPLSRHLQTLLPYP